MRIKRSRKQAKVGRRSPKKGISKGGLVQRPTNLSGKGYSNWAGKTKKFSKNPWECKNGTGQGCPKE